MIELIENPDARWLACERSLDGEGVSFPLYYRAIWARMREPSGVKCSLLSIRNSGGARGAFAFESAPTRALPGHRLVSLLRLGVGTAGLDDEMLVGGLRELVRIGHESPILRITVEIISLDPEHRVRTAAAAQAAGFARSATSRSYERTLVLDLSPDEQSLFAGLHKNARQGIRNVARFPVRVTTAASTSIAARLQDLADETRARTGGERRELDWEAIIEMSALAPELSRIAVLERTDVEGPERVIAFAWGCMHGNVCEYSESGSTRVHDLKVSTSYALLWDLVLWGKRAGARWFDFGGVTGGATHSDDPLGGISDFKRRFSQHEVDVGEQWELEPHPMRARAARAISSSADLVRRGISRLHR